MEEIKTWDEEGTGRRNTDGKKKEKGREEDGEKRARPAGQLNSPASRTCPLTSSRRDGGVRRLPRQVPARCRRRLAAGRRGRHRSLPAPLPTTPLHSAPLPSPTPHAPLGSPRTRASESLAGESSRRPAVVRNSAPPSPVGDRQLRSAVLVVVVVA
ncbi:Protein of unknown function [Gryllus bimaculatus]|nr:Protein of unknown function [Gryllus bimaculatus]